MRASGERNSDQDTCLIAPLQDAAPTLAVAYERVGNNEVVRQNLRALLFRGYEVQL